MTVAADRALIWTGRACNNRCNFCGQRSPPSACKAAAVRSTEDAIQDLQVERARGRRIVAFVGGEPTLHEQLPALIALAREQGFESIQVQTNGRRLAYSGYAKRLAHAGVGRIELSLAGPREEIHEYHSGVSGSFAQSVTGARAARSAGIRLSITFVITRSNFRHLAEMVELARRLGAEAAHLAITQPKGAALAALERLVPRFELLRSELATALRCANRRQFPVAVSGLPLCQVPEGATVGVVETGRVGAYAACCAQCARRDACSGVDPVYAERYGLGELLALGGASMTLERDKATCCGFLGLIDT